MLADDSACQTTLCVQARCTCLLWCAMLADDSTVKPSDPLTRIVCAGELHVPLEVCGAVVKRSWTSGRSMRWRSRRAAGDNTAPTSRTRPSSTPSTTRSSSSAATLTSTTSEAGESYRCKSGSSSTIHALPK